ncbi:MAG: ankyrin repeat domain-containing protein [Sphingobacteriales bacterium]
MKIMLKLFAIMLMMSSCTNSDTTSNLLGSDYRVFKNTPVWELAKSVEIEDTVSIKDFLKSHKQFVDYREPTFGQTLLSVAVYNRSYASVNTLLKFGADPNKQSVKSKQSALMVAASLGPKGQFVDARFLKLLLKYGGNPNDMQDGDSMQKGRKNYMTPLEFACLSSNLEYVRILVDAGANINLVSKTGFSPLFASVVSKSPDIVLYLLKHGADYKRPMLTNIQGEKKYILDVIDMWNFDKDSEEFKKENMIKDFLKVRCMNVK